MNSKQYAYGAYIVEMVFEPSVTLCGVKIVGYKNDLIENALPIGRRTIVQSANLVEIKK